MIRKTKHFDWIEDYCLGQLTEKQKLEFEAELGRNSELREELSFEMNLQSAVTEKEVLKLREALNEASDKNQQMGKDPAFKMLENLEDIQELTETVAPEDLLDFYESLPKVHVYQHDLVSNENIHQFYKEQNHYLSEMEDAEGTMDDLDLDEIVGLDEAVLEKDIFDLRNTLSQVARSVQPQFSVEDIDDYVSGKLDGKELELFEEEMSKNRTLKHEVEMHLEMEEAVCEIDIRSLRDEMSHIMKTETSWNVSEENIEEFIDCELEGELLEEFNAELEFNTDLKAELALRKNVNESIAEKDIFSLRDKLKQAKGESDSKAIKSIVPSNDFEIGRWWKAGVAVAIIVLSMAGILNREMLSLYQGWDNYYTSPEWSAQRSVMNTSDVDYFKEAKTYISDGQLEKGIKVYSEAISKVDEKFPYQFWKASTLQEMNKYNEAIVEYTNVIKHGDNNYIEEAEWYRSYCYIKLEDWDSAKEQLLAIIERKGYFESDAKAILRRLRYSFK